MKHFLVLSLLLCSPVYAGFCKYDCKKDAVPGNRELSRRSYRPGLKQLRNLTANLSSFSAKYDRFQSGDLPEGPSYQKFLELSAGIIKNLTDNPGLIRVLPLGQLTGFVQRAALDRELFEPLENMFLAMERDLLTYLERQGLGLSAWEHPSDMSGWKKGLKTANDLLLLLSMHRQFVEPHEDGGIKEIMVNFQERMAKAVLSGCELIRHERPEELEQFLLENRQDSFSLTSNSEITGSAGSVSLSSSENFPLFEPIYGRYGLVGEMVSGYARRARRPGM